MMATPGRHQALRGNQWTQEGGGAPGQEPDSSGFRVAPINLLGSVTSISLCLSFSLCKAGVLEPSLCKVLESFNIHSRCVSLPASQLTDTRPAVGR